MENLHIENRLNTMPKKLIPEKYLNSLYDVEVEKIGFVDISSKLHVDNLTDGQIEVDATNEVEIQIDQNKRTFAAIDKYSFSGRIKGNQVFEISTKILTVFKSRVVPDQAFIHVFEKNTLKVITYPYVRQLIQDLTSKMGLQPFVLPMWRVPKQADEKYLKPSKEK